MGMAFGPAGTSEWSDSPGSHSRQSKKSLQQGSDSHRDAAGAGVQEHERGCAAEAAASAELEARALHAGPKDGLCSGDAPGNGEVQTLSIVNRRLVREIVPCT